MREKYESEVLTRTPAAKFTDWGARDILKHLSAKRNSRGEYVTDADGKIIVDGCRFENERRVLDAINRLAKLLGVELRKLPQKR